MQATIVNRTPQTLAVLHEDFAAYIPPNSSDSEIPTEAAQAFKERKDVKTLVKAGKIRVLIPNSTEAEAASEVEVSEAVEVDVKSFLALDWKTAVSKVQVMTDLDALEELFAAETRARVVTAIEARIKLLTEDKTEIEIGEKSREVRKG